MSAILPTVIIEWLRRLFGRGGAGSGRPTISGAIVYVHGASDRATSVDHHVALIRAGLAAAGMDWTVVASRWGEAVGPTLDRIHLAIPGAVPAGPGAAPARGALAAPPAEVADEEPLAELAALADAADEPATHRTEALTGEAVRELRQRDADQLLLICRTDVDSGGVAGDRAGLADACRAAAMTVERSAEYARAQRAATSEEELVAATGRAVAELAAQSAGRGALEAIQLRIAEAVIGIAGGTLLAGYLGIDVGPALKRWATDTILPHRARLMREVLGPADVLVYQRNGHPIRSFVRDTIAQALAGPRPVVALGNSLGGVVLVDALAETASPRPELLVTVGSQAPALATFGALHPLNANDGHRPFEPWLNIYDPRDLLAFVARPVWPDVAGITDAAVDSGLGFPDSHGATYLSNPDVYRLIREHPAV